MQNDSDSCSHDYAASSYADRGKPGDCNVVVPISRVPIRIDIF